MQLLHEHGLPSAIFASAATDEHALPSAIVQAVRRADTRQAREAFARLYVEGSCAWVSSIDESYPYLLRMTHEPPIFLWYRGAYERLRDPQPIACVGSRSMSVYGEYCIETLIPPLVERGVTIVSGLALGVDAYAHEVAVRHGGRCVAVVASGLDDASLSPRSNVSTAQRILAQEGVLVSEYPPGTRPEAYHFPIRNRIISGLARAVLVIEARVRSGTLITAHHALDEGRDVFACPGPLQAALSEGTNRLLWQGAMPALNADDIAEALGLSAPSPTAITGTQTALVFDREELMVLELLKEGERTVEQLHAASALPTHRLLSTLSSLELKRVVRVTGHGRYLYTP